MSQWPSLIRSWLRDVREREPVERAIDALKRSHPQWQPLAAHLREIAGTEPETEWPALDLPPLELPSEEEMLTIMLLGNHRLVMLCHFEGHQAFRQAALAQGIAAAAKSIPLAEQLGDEALMAFYRSVAARAFCVRGEWDEAREALLAASTTFERLGDSSSTALALGNLAEVERLAGDRAAARQAAAAAVAALGSPAEHQTGTLMQRYGLLMQLGGFEYQLGQYAAACSTFDHAAADARLLSWIAPLPQLQQQWVEALCDGAAAYFALNEFPTGHARLLEGLELISGWPDHDEELMNTAGKLLNSLAYAQHRLGDLVQAKQTAESALTIRRRLFDIDPRRHRENLTMTLNLLGRIERDADPTATRRYAEAWLVAGDTPKRATEVTLPEWTEHARRAFTLHRYGDFARAIETCEDERIRQFLRAVTPLGTLDYPIHQLTTALANENRRVESALVTCLFNYGELEKLRIRELAAIMVARGFEPEPYIALGRLCEEAELLDCAAAILFLTGKTLCEAFDESRGLEILLRARADLEASGRQELLMTLHASILNSIGAARRATRDHAGAAAVLREAVELRRILAADGDPSETTFLGNALYNLGNVLSHIGDPDAAKYLTAALEAYRRVGDDTLSLQAKCLSVLGSEAANRRDMAALRYFGHALAAARRAHAAQAEMIAAASQDERTAAFIAHDPILLSTLIDYAQMLVQTVQWRNAEPLVDEALALIEQLAPHMRRQLAVYHATATNLRAELLRRMDRTGDAASAAGEAIAVAEQSEREAGDRYRVKGPVRAAYHARLRERAGTGDAAGVYAVLCSLRSGHFIDSAGAGALAAAREQVGEIERAVGRRVAVLIAEDFPDAAFLALLTREGLAPLVVDSAFDRAASALWRRLDELRYDEDGADPMEELAQLGAAAWSALPEELRAAFASEWEVIISGDDHWAAFPWEALRGESSWLGQTRVLARWSDLSPGGLAPLRPCTFGDGAPVAAVLSAWDAIDTHKLPGALAESQAVTASLGARGYLLAGEEAMTGDKATSDALLRAIAQEPAILHFSGHGGIAFGQEVLVTAGGAPFGPAELREYRRRHGAARVFRRNPLVVLNCCHAGRTHSFGGEREDLAGLLLAQGCAAVIAWPVEVDDVIGARVGQLLYETTAGSAADMGTHLTHVRRTIAAEFPHDPVWMLLQYHGNPYAALPV